jgi:hypothetical protein
VSLDIERLAVYFHCRKSNDYFSILMVAGLKCSEICGVGFLYYKGIDVK